MALKIRMARGGAKKRPFYRIVVAENTSPRDGRFVERIGHYNPLLEQGHAERVVLDVERAKYWLSRGAKPSERVELFLAQAGVLPGKAPANRPKKSAPKKKAQERLKAEAERAAAAAETTEPEGTVEAEAAPAATETAEPEGTVEAEAAADAPAEATE